MALAGSPRAEAASLQQVCLLEDRQDQVADAQDMVPVVGPAAAVERSLVDLVDREVVREALQLAMEDCHLERQGQEALV